jgi:hypothetical protein
MEKNQRHPVQAFLAAAQTRLSKDDKVNIALGIYLTLEAINESAPRGCDGMPMDLTVGMGKDQTCVQEILKSILGRLGCPVPPEPDPIFEEGRCGCGGKLSSEGFH